MRIETTARRNPLRANGFTCTSVFALSVFTSLYISTAIALADDPLAVPVMVASENAREFPTMPDLTLTTPTDFPTESAYRTAMAQRADAVAQHSTTVTDSIKRASLLLASANISLSYELEPFCSRTFLQLKTGVEMGESGDPGQILAKARDRINQALEALAADDRAESNAETKNEGHEENSDKGTEKGRYSLRHSLLRSADVLKAFSGAQHAYLREPNEAGDDADASRNAASRLASALEDEDGRIARAALFWQSVLRSRESNPQVVLSKLQADSAVRPSASDSYFLFGNILRCEVLARHLPRPVALTFLLQLEERCFELFGDAADRDPALRATAAVRIRVLRDWYDGMDASKSDEERAWCVREAQRIVDDQFSGEAKTLPRLTPAIPVIVPVPDGTPIAGDQAATP